MQSEALEEELRVWTTSNHFLNIEYDLDENMGVFGDDGAGEAEEIEQQDVAKGSAVATTKQAGR